MEYIELINQILNKQSLFLHYCGVATASNKPRPIVINKEDMLEALRRVDNNENQMSMLPIAYKVLHQMTYDYIRKKLIQELRKAKIEKVLNDL